MILRRKEFLPSAEITLPDQRCNAQIILDPAADEFPCGLSQTGSAIIACSIAVRLQEACCRTGPRKT